jgi:hypothetical protein
MNTLTDAQAQLQAVDDFFNALSGAADGMPAVDPVAYKNEEEMFA